MSRGALYGALSVRNRPPEQAPTDPNLAMLIKAWPQLSDDIRTAILRVGGIL